MKNLIFIPLLFIHIQLSAAVYRLVSPGQTIELEISVADSITWSLFLSGDKIMGPSSLSLALSDGRILGQDTRVRRALRTSHNQVISTPIYRKSEVSNHYNQISIELRDGLGIIFRVFDDGAAYRLTTNIKQELTIQNEEVNLVFPTHQKAWVPYITARTPDPYITSFESTYQALPLEEIVPDTLIILPVLVEAGKGRKIVVTEVDLEGYPGMFLTLNASKNGFKGRFAPYPLEEVRGGHNNLQALVTKRADFIAKTEGQRSFPWRAIAVSTHDAQLLDNDLVARLAAHNRIGNLDWIRPGKVAWEWWNALNVYNVDFRAGVNTQTYKYYIDFAADNGIEYVILDEGWSEQESLLQIKPYIDLPEILLHAKTRGVGIILWAGWLPLNKEMEEVMKTYSALGVAGYKIDFMDRDDQPMVEFYYRVAEMAARYRQLVNFHGAYKPTGLQFTYPNVITFEGVYGLENVKWTDYTDMPGYAVTIPFIRALAGPMDYTPGAMVNATRHSWRAIFSNPMSQGTRCHQMAMYVVFESPLSMLADNPTHYKREPQSTAFIASIPTVFDQTIPLHGQLGEYVAIARRRNQNWYLGAMTNWQQRELKIDLAFLGNGDFVAEIFSDGINADRDARDYTRQVLRVTKFTKLDIKMLPGGGWAAIIKPLQTK